MRFSLDIRISPWIISIEFFFSWQFVPKKLHKTACKTNSNASSGQNQHKAVEGMISVFYICLLWRGLSFRIFRHASHEQSQRFSRCKRRRMTKVKLNRNTQKRCKGGQNQRLQTLLPISMSWCSADTAQNPESVPCLHNSSGKVGSK